MFQKSLLILVFGIFFDATFALQTTPDLGTLANDDADRSYDTPVLTCHSNFNVTIEAGNWALIAVEGFELIRGNYGNGDYGNTNQYSECVSIVPYADLHFDVQDNCHGGPRNTMKEFNNTYTWTLRARAEWMVETQQDRLFPMKCEYTLTGEAQWESVTKVVTQIFSTEAAVEATRAVKINGSTIHLVNANDADDGTTDQNWAHLDSVTVGQQVRFLINTTNTGWHSETPHVGVTGCWFYDRDPYDPDAMEFNLVDQHGCNKPPSYYDPFTAATTPGVNGMYLNVHPVDDWNPSVGASANPASNPTDGGTTPPGYLSGGDQFGYAYSDKLKMFKFPGTNQVWAKCELRFCVERDDPRCITPNCIGRFYTGTYDINGAYGQVFKRRRRSADTTDQPHYKEDVITVIAVNSPGTTTKIGVNGPGDMLTLESGMAEGMSAECETKFYAVLAVTICLGLALLGILIVYLFKRAAGRISPVDKARFIEDHYGRPNSVGGGMYGGGMRMNMMGNNNGGLPMISK